jgi:hypothetical protein
MNNRIIEFVTATDAWCDQNLPSDWTDDVDKYLPVWNEKFAELIIQECIEAVMEGDRYRRDYFADKIKQRFGVK